MHRMQTMRACLLPAASAAALPHLLTLLLPLETTVSKGYSPARTTLSISKRKRHHVTYVIIFPWACFASKSQEQEQVESTAHQERVIGPCTHLFISYLSFLAHRKDLCGYFFHCITVLLFEGRPLRADKKNNHPPYTLRSTFPPTPTLRGKAQRQSDTLLPLAPGRGTNVTLSTTTGLALPITSSTTYIVMGLALRLG